MDRVQFFTAANQLRSPSGKAGQATPADVFENMLAWMTDRTQGLAATGGRRTGAGKQTEGTPQQKNGPQAVDDATLQQAAAQALSAEAAPQEQAPDNAAPEEGHSAPIAAGISLQAPIPQAPATQDAIDPAIFAPPPNPSGGTEAAQTESQNDFLVAEAPVQTAQAPPAELTVPPSDALPDRLTQLVDDATRELEQILPAQPEAAETEPLPDLMDAHRTEIPSGSIHVLDTAQAPAKPAARKPEAPATATSEAAAAASRPEPADTAPTQRQSSAEPPRQVEVPQQMQQIRAEVLNNLELQRTEFRMQLHPQELGKVDVRMVLEDGRLAIEILTANPKTAELLRGQTESLAAAMRGGEVEIKTIQVTHAETLSPHMSGAFNRDFAGSAQQNQQPGQEQAKATGIRGSVSGSSDTAHIQDLPQLARRLNYAI